MQKLFCMKRSFKQKYISNKKIKEIKTAAFYTGERHSMGFGEWSVYANRDRYPLDGGLV